MTRGQPLPPNIFPRTATANLRPLSHYSETLSLRHRADNNNDDWSLTVSKRRHQNLKPETAAIWQHHSPNVPCTAVSFARASVTWTDRSRWWEYRLRRLDRPDWTDRNRVLACTVFGSSTCSAKNLRCPHITSSLREYDKNYFIWVFSRSMSVACLSVCL